MIRAALIALALFLMAGLPLQAQEAVARFGSGPTSFLLRSTTDISVIRPVVARFAELHPDLTIDYEQWGSNALFARSRAGCEGDGPPADAIFSSAVQQMVWLVNAACALPHRSEATLALPEARRWRDELWGVTMEPAVIAYNTERLSGDEVPRSRFALLDAMRSRPGQLRGRIATYDITASGLGYLFAYSDSLEATTFGSMLEGFARVDAVATCCSTEIIESVARGEFLIAYNVLGSYVANAQTPGVGVILPEDYTLILSRAFMIPRRTKHADIARQLLDFLLSEEAQTMLAEAGLVMKLDAADSGLAPSARRFIELSPRLLVALDRNRRSGLFGLWRTYFRKSRTQ